MPAKKQSHSLQDTYSREILRGLTSIKRSLSKLKEDPGKKKELDKIRNAARTISDLAMIHGFEGVENIAEKIWSQINKATKLKVVDKSLLAKIDAAANGIQRIAEMEKTIESQMNVERISKGVQLNQQKLESCTKQLSDNLDNLNHNQQEMEFDDTNEIKPDELFFDINEIDSVIKIEPEKKRITIVNENEELFKEEIA